jgi:hypothetical protein
MCLSIHLCPALFETNDVFFLQTQVEQLEEGALEETGEVEEEEGKVEGLEEQILFVLLRPGQAGILYCCCC